MYLKYPVNSKMNKIGSMSQMQYIFIRDGQQTGSRRETGPSNLISSDFQRKVRRSKGSGYAAVCDSFFSFSQNY